MLLFINVFLLIFNVIPREIFCVDVETEPDVTSVKESPVKEQQKDRNGRLIGLLGLLAGLNFADTFEDEDEFEPERHNQVINKRTSPDWPSSLKFAYITPSGKIELLLNPNAYQDLLLHHYYPYYLQNNNRHVADIQTIKVSSSSNNPIIQTSSPLLAETTVVNNLPEIIINKKGELRSGTNSNKKRKVINDGKRAQKLMETTTINAESDATEIEPPTTLEPFTLKRWKKEAEVTTVTDETLMDTTTEFEPTTTLNPEQNESDSLTEGSDLTQVLQPPSHTIAIFKPTVPTKGDRYGVSSLNNIDLIYLTTESPLSYSSYSHKFKTFYKFRPSQRDYFLDKKDEFVPLYFKDVNSNHYELPLSDTANSVLYEFEPLLN